MNNRHRSFWFQVKGLLAFIGLLLMTQSSLLSQTLKYEAFINGKKIGEMTVLKEVSDEREKIYVKGHCKLSFDSLVSLEFESSSDYMDGTLVSSASSMSLNQSKAQLINMDRVKEGYRIERSGKKNTITLEADIFGNDILYFEEPERIQRTYSLFSGKCFFIMPKENNSYHLVRFDDHLFEGDLFDSMESLLHYENGVLREFSSHFQSQLITFKLTDCLLYTSDAADE